MILLNNRNILLFYFIICSYDSIFLIKHNPNHYGQFFYLYSKILKSEIFIQIAKLKNRIQANILTFIWFLPFDIYIYNLKIKK